MSPSWVLRFASFLALVGTSGPAWGDDEAMSKQAQEAFERGAVAFKAKDWALAIRYFSESQRAAPYNPGVLFNLGVAHARAGHDLASAAWLRAYLAAVPPAAEERKCQTCGTRLVSDGGCPGCVKAETVRLEVATESVVGKIFRQATDLATKLEDPAESQRALEEILSAQERCGDIEGGLATLRRLNPASESYAYWRDHLGERRAADLMAQGDRAGADAALRDVTSPYRDLAGAVLVRSSLERGDLDSALGSDVFRYCGRGRRDAEIGYFVGRQIGKGNFTLVDKVLPSLGTTYQLSLLATVADKNLELGDPAGAREAIKRGLAIANKLTSKSQQTGACARFAALALRAGDEATARAAAEQVVAAGAPTESNEFLRAALPGREPPEPGISVRSTALAAAILGKHEEARTLISRFEGGGENWGPYTPPAWVSLMQCLVGRPDEARKTAKAAAWRESPSNLPGATSAVAIVRHHLSRSELKEARDVMTDPDAQFGSVGHDQELNVSIALAFAKAGDLEAARKAYRSAEYSGRRGDPGFVADGLWALAKTFSDRHASVDALNILTYARKVASEEPLCETLTRIAELQASLGDSKGAAQTRAQIHPPALKKWVARALASSGNEVVVDLGAALGKAPTGPKDGTSEPCKPADVPGQIARVGAKLRQELEWYRWMVR